QMLDEQESTVSGDVVLRHARAFSHKERVDVSEATEVLREIVEGMLKSPLGRVVGANTQDEIDENWELDSIIEYVHGNLLSPEDISVDDIKGKEPDEIIDFIFEKVKVRYDEKEQELTPEQMREFEKVIVLRTVDTKWMDHIDQMDQLRQGIHLRAYGQNDPLQEYQAEGFQMFEEMVV